MGNLSREERTEQHISKLEKRILELAVNHKKNKWLRTKITFFVLSGLVYVVALSFCDSMAEVFGWLVFAPLVTIGAMFISYAILAYIINGVKKDFFAIGEMVGRKDAIELSKLNKE
jgi:heme/copper-type cytochrome/quinol oxidase subunit 1